MYDKLGKSKNYKCDYVGKKLASCDLSVHRINRNKKSFNFNKLICLSQWKIKLFFYYYFLRLYW